MSPRRQGSNFCGWNRLQARRRRDLSSLPGILILVWTFSCARLENTWPFKAGKYYHNFSKTKLFSRTRRGFQWYTSTLLVKGLAASIKIQFRLIFSNIQWDWVVSRNTISSVTAFRASLWRLNSSDCPRSDTCAGLRQRLSSVFLFRNREFHSGEGCGRWILSRILVKYRINYNICLVERRSLLAWKHRWKS